MIFDDLMCSIHASNFRFSFMNQKRLFMKNNMSTTSSRYFLASFLVLVNRKGDAIAIVTPFTTRAKIKECLIRPESVIES